MDPGLLPGLGVSVRLHIHVLPMRSYVPLFSKVHARLLYLVIVLRMGVSLRFRRIIMSMLA